MKLWVWATYEGIEKKRKDEAVRRRTSKTSGNLRNTALLHFNYDIKLRLVSFCQGGQKLLLKLRIKPITAWKMDCTKQNHERNIR